MKNLHEIGRKDISKIQGPDESGHNSQFILISKSKNSSIDHVKNFDNNNRYSTINKKTGRSIVNSVKLTSSNNSPKKTSLGNRVINESSPHIKSRENSSRLTNDLHHDNGHVGNLRRNIKHKVKDFFSVKNSNRNPNPQNIDYGLNFQHNPELHQMVETKYRGIRRNHNNHEKMVKYSDGLDKKTSIKIRRSNSQNTLSSVWNISNIGNLYGDYTNINSEVFSDFNNNAYYPTSNNSDGKGNYYKLGSLGPNKNTEWHYRKVKIEKMKRYSNLINEVNNRVGIINMESLKEKVKKERNYKIINSHWRKSINFAEKIRESPIRHNSSYLIDIDALAIAETPKYREKDASISKMQPHELLISPNKEKNFRAKNDVLNW